MKRFLLSLTILCIGAVLFAQAPQSFKYQTVVRDDGGVIKANQDVSFRISILEELTPVYVEKFVAVETNDYGLVTLEIGNGTLVSGDFTTIDWKNDGPFSLKTEIDMAGGETFTDVGTSTLLSVPFALHARTAANVDELEARLDSLILALSPPFADFSADNTTIIIGNTVNFTDESTNNPESWSWDFGDGSPASTEQNPSHSYSSLGAFTVILTASNEYGDDIEEKVDFITVNPPPPVAAFSSDKTEIIANESVNFTDESTNTPTAWSWDFGDGSPASTDQNPSHTYTDAGTYTVTLTATNIWGSDDEVKTDLITVYPEGTLIDYDGNVYSTVTIGTQVWMAENLKVIHYSDGVAIPLVTGDGSWASLLDDNTDKAYCWYNDDNENYGFYGAYYTYAAATNGDNTGNDVQGACPVGWHIPSDSEWEVLYTYLGGLKGTTGSQLAGNEALWTDGLLDSNEDFGTSGFNGIPAGGRSHTDGSFTPEGIKAYFWSSTESSYTDQSGKIELDYNDAGIFRHNIHYKSSAISIRCIKDSGK